MGKDIREKKDNLLATKPPGLNRKSDLNPFFGSQPFTFTCVVYHAEERRTPGDDCLTLQPKAHFCGFFCSIIVPSKEYLQEKKIYQL